MLKNEQNMHTKDNSIGKTCKTKAHLEIFALHIAYNMISEQVEMFCKSTSTMSIVIADYSHNTVCQ